MGKLISIAVIVGLLLMYGKYLVQMQQQAMQNLNVIKYQYSHAEELATQLH